MKRMSNKIVQGLIVLALGLATSLGSSQISHAAIAQIGPAHAMQRVMHPLFNPQPDPPGRRNGIAVSGVHPAFNPQPDPPGRRHAIVVGRVTPATTVQATRTASFRAYQRHIDS